MKNAGMCSKGTKGMAFEMIVAARLMLDGWGVYLAASPNSPVDVIAFKDGVSRFIEVRAGQIGVNGRLYYPKLVHDGYPRPTEMAVYVASNDSIHYLPISPGK